MFRHRDKGRTYAHNIRLASLLSAVAGIVNIVGVLSVHTLTTNVTGHFAFFSEGLFLKDDRLALLSILYVACFFIGAFIANTCMELTSKQTVHFSYILPITLECILLTGVSLSSCFMEQADISVACLLLFAMGLQNALVTKVSGSVVRTTHLTGLFTDLGIELSQLFFYKKLHERNRLRKAILLKIVIIGGFFIGGIIGASLYGRYAMKTLLLPVAILMIALYYDRLRLGYYRYKRKLHDHYRTFLLLFVL